MANPMEPARIEVNKIDIRIVIAIGICALTSTILKLSGLTIESGGRSLEIIQAMTASISCLLCVQDNLAFSKRAGWIRIKVTAAAAIVALVVVSVDTMIGNAWISVLLLMAGVLMTVFLCKVLKAPYMNCRIGGVNYVLMACTLTGSTRLLYTGFRVLSTLYGVLVVVFVTWICSLYESRQNTCAREM